MEQKSKQLKKTTKKDPSKAQLDTTASTASTSRYSLRSRKKEPLPVKPTRSHKRKVEQGQQTQEPKTKKKTKIMENSSNSKGKQKAEDKPTSSATEKKDVMKTEEQFNDDIHYNEEEEEWDEEQEPKHDFEEEEEDDDDDDDDEEEDEEGDDEELSRVRRTLGLQMQGLFGGMMSSDFGRFKSILSSLKTNDDPTMQLIALQELAEILSVSSEENLAGYFSSDSFSRELIRIMKGPDSVLPEGADMDEDMMLALAMSEGFSGGNPEVMLLACRCISNLLEAMPTAVTSIVSHGAIRVLCQKLKSIQYIDLAEQALYALEKISAQLPRAVVNEGGLSAALMYFDFFSIHAQRTALRTASNCMRGIDMDSFPQVLEVTPTLMNTITYSDRSVVELTCLCWVRISEGYRSNRECLERAINVDLLKILYGLIPIPGNANAVHPATFQDLLRIFRSISKASPQLSFELLKLDIIESFYQILTGASSVPDFETTNAQHHITLDSKWRDSVPTIMKIIVDLLPSLPKDTMFSSRRFKSNHSSPSAAVTETAVDPRVEWFKETPQVLFKLDLILIPLILDMYASTVNLRVRQLVTRTLVKLLHYSDSETLSKVLKNVTLSSFLSGILTRQEHPVLLIDALYQTELMIQKLPQVYHFLFEREGVLHEIESLSKLPYVEEEETVVNQQSQKKESDSLPNTQPSEDINNTTVDESDGTTTDADNIKREPSNNDKKDDEEEDDEEDEDEDESDNDNPSKGKRSGKSASTKSVGSSSGLRSPSSSASQRRLFDSADLQAMMRNHHLLQHQQRVSRHQHYSENEKGVGRGSTRKYIIQLAQHFVQHYFNKTSEDGTPLASAGSSLKEIVQFTNDLLSPTDQDPASEQTLIKLSAYLRDSIMGISSFELINTGLMKALLAYLTQSDDTQWKVPLKSRIQLFEHIFVDQPDIDVDGNNALKKLVVRLQEILSRSETFEVVTPMESPLGTDSLRNPTSMLAKQLRLRLSGTGDDIPSNYKQLMVSTHAVATFRVLEDYLLARISAASSLMRDMEEEEDEDEEDEVEIDEEDHLLIEDENNRDHMDVDEDHDTVMSEALDVTKDETEGEEEDESQGKQTKEDAKASSSTNTKPTTGASDKTATSKKDGEWKIRFSLNDSVISNDSTVYAAVHQYEMSSLEGRATFAGQSRLSSRNIWASSYPVTYERIWVPHTESDEEEGKKSSSTVVRQLADIGLPKDLKEDSTCYQVLQLLKALSPAIAKHPHGISAQDFINRKLTAKANRQLEEPLIVASSCLPTWIYWLMSETPFLFPFETRYLFIQSTSFGYARLIARWQSLQMRNNTQNGPRNDTSDQQPVLGRMERQKVRIMRTQMLESAIKILDLFGSSPTVLEIEYMGEEGTGMGPTLEFYASTSKEFSKHSLNMWRGSNKTEKGFVQSASGLFPKTLAKSSSRSTKKIVHLFKALGQFIAKGLLDFRIIDIPFSPAFFKIVLDDLKPSPELLKEIDSQLAKSIHMLQSYIKQKREIYADKSKSSEEKAEAIKDIQVDNAKLEDLCLDFTLPGDATYELKPGGSDIPVTIHNVEEYIDLVQDAIIGSGITQQIAAFREGFNGLFAIDDLKLLTHAELVSLFGKADEDWSYTTLAGTMRADHGFTMDSDPVRYLLEILSDFSDVEKRQFLQFTTGSPRLPIGGWKALRPVFTVVRKIPEAPLTADDYLPSVMTCANYFKMPAYTSKEIMRQRLLTSMEEGQNSFLLS